MKKQLQQRELNAAGRRTECLAAIAGAILMFGAGAVQADCVATPDCESLGYRETSCVGGGVKCPWDTSKMYCNPNMCSLTLTKEECAEQCREVGEQSCVKNGVTYYAQCGVSKCPEGQGCKAGACVTCDNTCAVGNMLYSDFTCSSCLLNDKTPIGIIAYSSGSMRLAVQLDTTESKPWSNTLVDIAEIANTASSTYKTEFNGKSNAQAWVNKYGTDKGSYAAGYCYNYSTDGTGKGQWFLPSGGEMTAVLQTNRTKIAQGLTTAGGKAFQSGNHWTSSERSASEAWQAGTNGGSSADKTSSAYVRCVLHLEDKGNGAAENCSSEYKYSCSGSAYAGGSGMACGGMYQSCKCANGASWNGSGCGCDTAYQYSCSGTNISGGSGSSCNGKYASCNCVSGANWNGSGCVCDSSYQYACTGTGYVSGTGGKCNGKYQECSCAGDYDWSGSACVCKPEFQFTCSGTGYAGGVGNKCNNKYQSCTCSSGYGWRNNVCSKCETEYKFDCATGGSDPYITGGRGDACSGKYKYCSCQTGYGWKRGKCTLCDASCSVGNILYSDMSCNSCIMEGKTPIGVIGYANGTSGLAVYLQQSSSELEWSGLSDTPTMTNFSSGATAIKDFSGKENSHNWTLFYGHTNTWNGIGYCHNLTTGGTQKRQWFVPALGEMNEIAVKNLEAVNDSLLALDTVGAAQIGTSYQYSSTEQNANNIYVSYQASATDKYTTRIKVQKNYYRCALPLDFSNGVTKPQACAADYVYTCEADSAKHIAGGSGTACGRHYRACACTNGYIWHNDGDVQAGGTATRYETDSCVPCSTYHKYTCSGSNITGAVGTVCAGKYEECSCASGYEWVNGACQACSSECKVGSILYSDKTCNSCRISGKTPIGVVAYVNGSTRLAINLPQGQMKWSSNYVDLDGIDNITDGNKAKADFAGKAHTAAWVAKYGAGVTGYAPGYCYNYSTAGTSKHDWYLPALGELFPSVWTNRVAVKRGLKIAGGDKLERGHYWSSSEYSYYDAWRVYGSNGWLDSGLPKANGAFYVRCVLAF